MLSAVKESIRPLRAWIDPCTLEVILYLVFQLLLVFLTLQSLYA